MTQPARVTVTETRANRFFKWLGRVPQTSFDEDWFRVSVCYRWKNLPPQYGGLKLIDFTGMLRGGMAFACEVKQQDLDEEGTDGRFSYSQISERQRDFLTYHHCHGGATWLFLGFTRKDQPIATFLIPWDQWLYIETVHARKFKDGHEKLWSSISYEWVRYYVPWAELYPWPIKVGGRREYAFYTHIEVSAWLVGKGNGIHTPPVIGLYDCYGMMG